MPEYKGIEYLKKKLATKRKRVLTRYRYYDMKNEVHDFGISTPPNMRYFQECLGWCAKAVDSMASRLEFREFDNDRFNFNQIFEMNNPDVLFSSAIHGALVGSCDFIYISKDTDGFPRLQVIDGANATGIIDPITNMLTEGYAVLQRDDLDNPIIEAYFTIGNTDIIERRERAIVTTSYPNKAPYALLVPIIFKPDATRPFGHSMISRACMSIQDSALRTIKRGEISAEFYSFPQKYVTGLDPDAEQMDKWRASMSSMLTFTKDADGDKPTLGQFTQQSMEPHLNQLRMFASLFAGETGLTLDDLGFATDNPSSAEAIKASHENLRLNARRAQKTFGSGFLNVGYLACCVRDDYSFLRKRFYMEKPTWEPIFETDFSALGMIGDGVQKINTAIPEYFDKTTLRNLTGIEAADE